MRLTDTVPAVMWLYNSGIPVLLGLSVLAVVIRLLA